MYKAGIDWCSTEKIKIEVNGIVEGLGHFLSGVAPSANSVTIGGEHEKLLPFFVEVCVTLLMREPARGYSVAKRVRYHVAQIPVTPKFWQ